MANGTSQNFSSPNEVAMRAGDVILIRSKGVLSFLNRAGQFILTGKIPQHTHVSLCVAPCSVIDATPKDHVKLRNVVREVIEKRLTDQMCEDGRMHVLRPPSKTWDDDKVAALKATIIQLGKRYNYGVLFPQSSDVDPNSEKAETAFCSELAAILLKQLLPIGARRPSATLPVHLERLTKADGWENVTDKWTQMLKEYRELAESELPKDCKHIKSLLETLDLEIQITLNLAQAENMQKALDKQCAQLDKKSAELTEKFIGLTKEASDLWDSLKPGRS